MGVKVPGAECAGDDELELGECVAGERDEGHGRAGPNPVLRAAGRDWDRLRRRAAVVSNKTRPITCHQPRSRNGIRVICGGYRPGLSVRYRTKCLPAGGVTGTGGIRKF